MEELNNCPICKGTEFTFLRKCRDFTVSQEEFSLISCAKCGLVFTNPRPDATNISKYYESPDYISHSNSRKGLINQLYQTVRSYSLKKKLALINQLKLKNKVILDIGCGTGEFLAVCDKDGWKTLGIEPNQSARNQAIENWNLKVYPESHLNSIDEKNKPQVITMWHVLEHVHSLEERLNQIKTLLQSNGYLIIAVPNPESWDAEHYQNHWAAYDVPRHLYHFSPSVLKKYIESSGFEHQKSIPMKFDSFYVSMLSEKYKRGKQNLINALFNGFRSNLKAKNDPEKYSSVIYIFRKK